MTVRPADYCPDCGTELVAREVEGRERHHCESCDRTVYQNPVPCADVTVVDGDSVLLVERAVPPGVGEWTIPGGHLEVGETPRAAAARELREETGMRADPADLALVETDLLDPFRGKYAVSIGFAISADAIAGEPTAGSDASAARFFAPRELSEGEFDLRPHVPDRIEKALDAV